MRLFCKSGKGRSPTAALVEAGQGGAEQGDAGHGEAVPRQPYTLAGQALMDRKSVWAAIREFNQLAATIVEMADLDASASWALASHNLRKAAISSCTL